ncbi:hypothetical protein [Streptomyces sp. NPDC048419]|uniref:hypothetical protein n=1 Tax=Streptomyces sp. NPDC048419 TaxID=3365547 RepID=UPI00371B51A1
MTGQLPPAEGDHYLYRKLPDAQAVATKALLRARENIADTVDARAMMCVYGASGCGKTFAVNRGLDQLEPVEVLDIPQLKVHDGPHGDPGGGSIVTRRVVVRRQGVSNQRPIC